MAERIIITPAELQAQSAELRGLEGAYSDLFSGVSAELRQINGNWSPNLAHNFEGKINSAQNTFAQITQDLRNGAYVANTCAVTFQSVDSELSKLYATGESTAGGTGILADALHGIPENVKSSAEVLEWLEKRYEEVPRELKGVVNMVVPGTLKSAYKFVSDLLQGELTWDSFLDVGRTVTSPSPYLLSVVETLEYTFDKGLARSDEMEKQMMAQLKEGDILGVVVDGAEGFIDTIIGGTVECLADVAGSSVDSFLGNIPVVGKGIKETTKYITGKFTPDGEEYSIGDLIGASGEALSEGLDKVTDVISDASDVVTDGITRGVKGVYCWVSGWLDGGD